MKGKNLCKVLAFLLAAVMIFTVLPLMAFASDETTTYTVSYGSPAIPMHEMTIVNLADISVEMERGTVVSGADITWAADAQDGIEFDAAAKTVFAKVAGRYKLTAIANGVRKNIWVLVNKAEDTEFVLVDYNFANGYNPDEWQFVLWDGSNKSTPVGYEADPAVNPGLIEYKNGYVAMGLNNDAQAGLEWLRYGVLINKNPIFDDFADYTITSLSSTKAGGTINGWGGPGLMGRVQLTDTGAIDNNNKAVITQFLGLGTVRVAVNTSTWWLVGFNNYTCDASYIKEDKGDVTKNDALKNGHYYWTNTTSQNEYKILKGVYSSENLAFSIDNTEVYNLSKAADADKTAWAKDANHAVDAGAPGVLVFGGKIQIKNFKVTLNSNELAPAKEVKYYNVSYAAPAIPMNENTGVNLKFVNVEMTKDNFVSGADITWTAAKQEGLYLNDASKKVSVYTAGNYKLTATYNGVHKNVWVIAKKADATEFNLVDYNFANGYNPDEWQFVLWDGSNKSTPVGYEADPVVNPGLIEYKNGYVAMGLNNDAQAGLEYLRYGVLINKNPIFDDFADYTITSLSSTKAGGAINGWGGPGLMGRVQLTDTGAIDNNNKAVITQFLGLGTVRVAVNTSTWWLIGLNNYTCDASYIKEDKGDVTKNDALKNGHYYWTNTTSQNEYKILKGVYSGENLAFSIDDTEIYNLSKAADADKTAWAKDANHAVDAGAPGVLVFGGKIQVKNFKVTLNSNEMPDAIAAEEKPAEPKPRIDITGLGAAEVEAVVGSDNTYTVELAPAEGYKMKTLSLMVNGNMLVNLNHDKDTGLVYTFTADDLANAVISVEFIPDDGTFNTVMAGASVWQERSAIRFGARTDLIKRSTTNTAVGVLDNRIKVGDTVYKITEVGMLLIPKGLLDGDLTVDTKNVARQQVTKVVTLTDVFSDIAINLIGIPESYYDTKISSCMYVAYEVDGVTKYVYTEVIERSYNDVLKAIGK